MIRTAISTLALREVDGWDKARLLELLYTVVLVALDKASPTSKRTMTNIPLLYMYMFRSYSSPSRTSVKIHAI